MKYTSRKTLYRNTIFRSSLEAEWAAFFDAHNIKWKYEPQSFTDGISWYLPDFFLPYCRLRNYSTTGVWLEIKPNQYINGVRTFDLFKKKYELMSMVPNINFCVFFGHPTIEKQSDIHEGYQIYPWYDNYMRFMKCPHCGTVKIEFDESNYNNCSICGTQSKTIMGYP